MKIKLFFFLISVFFSLHLISADTIIVDGIERNFIIHLPANYNQSQKIPLIIALHGGGGKAENTNKLMGLDIVADKYSFIVV